MLSPVAEKYISWFTPSFDLGIEVLQLCMCHNPNVYVVIVCGVMQLLSPIGMIGNLSWSGEVQLARLSCEG